MIHVLAVDDSAVAREMLKLYLESAHDVELEVVPSVAIAEKRIERRAPDVILLDLEMPVKNGVQWMTELRDHSRIPIVICSESDRQSRMAREALSLGAVDIIKKPKLLGGQTNPEEVAHLVATVRGAAGCAVSPQTTVSRLSSLAAGVVVEDGSQSRILAAGPAAAKVVIAIGVSTGGPTALRNVLPKLPLGAPPVVVAQHMAEGYTGALAESLNDICRVHVTEARQGDVLEPGRVYIAPSGFQTEVRDVGGTLRLDIHQESLGQRYRPSVNVLFRSVVRAVHGNAVGVLMTGMGDDGAQGLLEMREAGAYTLVQDEASCAVYGMPRAGRANGAAKREVALDGMAGAIIHHARQVAQGKN